MEVEFTLFLGLFFQFLTAIVVAWVFVFLFRVVGYPMKLLWQAIVTLVEPH